MFWVVSYDIADNKRRRKVSDILEGYGRRTQYSVFECDIDDIKRHKLAARLNAAIDAQEDDIRFYPLNEADIKRVVLLGRAVLRRKEPYIILTGKIERDDSDDPF